MRYQDLLSFIDSLGVLPSFQIDNLLTLFCFAVEPWNTKLKGESNIWRCGVDSSVLVGILCIVRHHHHISFQNLHIKRVVM